MRSYGAYAVRFESFQRRCSGLFQRNIEPLHGSQRFAQFAAEFWRRPGPERPAPSPWTQPSPGPRRACRQSGSSRPSIPAHTRCPGCQSLRQCRPCCPPADTDRAASSGVSFASGGTRHQLQSPHYFTFGEQIQERRLPQRDARAVFRVSSKIASPVLLAKSATTMVSFSVRRRL